MVFSATDYVAEKFTLHDCATNPGFPDSQQAIDVYKRISKKLDSWVDKDFNK